MQPDLFDRAADQLERSTDLDRLEARGTLRIALKEAGLGASSLTLVQLETVFEKLMPQQLEQRAVNDFQAVCSAVMKEIRLVEVSADTSATINTDEIFGRLGGR